MYDHIDLVLQRKSHLLGRQVKAFEWSVYMMLKDVFLQVREMFHENGMLHGQLMTTKDCLKTAEAELEISQEKVAKLAAEVDENRKNASSSAIDMDNMKIVRTLAGFSSLFVVKQ